MPSMTFSDDLSGLHQGSATSVPYPADASVSPVLKDFPLLFIVDFTYEAAFFASDI